MFDMLIGAGAIVVAYLVFLMIHKGASAAGTKVKTWWTATQTEMKTMIADVEKRVTVIEGKVGIAKPAPAPAPTAPVAAPAPAAPAA